MKRVLRAKGAFLVAMMAMGWNANAGDWQPFREEAFRKAQSDGKTIVLDFNADWCSTCTKQKPVLEEVLKEDQFSHVVGFTVDFDKTPQLKKALRVQRQSTLVVYQGRSEVARAVGETSKEKIRSLILAGA